MSDTENTKCREAIEKRGLNSDFARFIYASLRTSDEVEALALKILNNPSSAEERELFPLNIRFKVFFALKDIISEDAPELQQALGRAVTQYVQETMYPNNQDFRNFLRIFKENAPDLESAILAGVKGAAERLIQQGHLLIFGALSYVAKCYFSEENPQILEVINDPVLAVQFQEKFEEHSQAQDRDHYRKLFEYLDLDAWRNVFSNTAANQQLLVRNAERAVNADLHLPLGGNAAKSILSSDKENASFVQTRPVDSGALALAG